MGEYICTYPIIPLRLGPSHWAEMGSQILMGERYSIVDKVGVWTKIKVLFDGYTGWVDNDHIIHIPFDNKNEPFIINHEIEAKDNRGLRVVLYPGSEIYDYNSSKGSFTVGKNSFTAVQNIVTDLGNETIIDTALRFINAPYLWGGKSGHGIDCSGLSQLCFKIHGKTIPRNSFNQATIGDTINLLSDSIPGDLLFFDNNLGKITHVGILYDKDNIIHASGTVRIDRVDHQGIFNVDFDRYTHKLRLIKRV